MPFPSIATSRGAKVVPSTLPVVLFIFVTSVPFVQLPPLFVQPPSIITLSTRFNGASISNCTPPSIRIIAGFVAVRDAAPASCNAFAGVSTGCVLEPGYESLPDVLQYIIVVPQLAFAVPPETSTTLIGISTEAVQEFPVLLAVAWKTSPETAFPVIEAVDPEPPKLLVHE